MPVKIRTGFSILDAIQSLFPLGYLDHALYRSRTQISPDAQRPPFERHKSFVNPPCQAVDLFAIAGFLLLKSGGYHHVSPSASGASTVRVLSITSAERAAWVAAGEKWRGEGRKLLPVPPAELIRAWQELMACKHLPLYLTRKPSASPRPWWRAALTLFIIADEAARDLGFETGRKKSAQAAYSEAPMRQIIAKGGKTFTLSGADRDQVCVLPKSRTPKVGCTLRSLSHNLALLPARGLARAYWSPGPELAEDEALTSIEAPFNVVVVPAPFRIRASAFSGVAALGANWGWFEVKPHWCPSSGDERTEDGINAFHAFVEQILDAARAEVGDVHGLVLPECALSYDVFRHLCEKLESRPGFELFIAGLFDAKEPDQGYRKGNFAAMARREKGADGNFRFDISTREKHHRWRVEKSQIDAYALGSALDANRGWWERIDILSRSLDVFVLRGGATVTTLICEDLARNDPCQELVRAIGPNLVVALLMDGPQLKERWPARYATVLAEDPGSSVLTLTSLGLVRRSNESGQFRPSDKIGLWRDDSGRTVELAVPNGAHALCLTLQPGAIQEWTLDGRGDDHSAQSWQLTGVCPVTLSNPDSAILDGRWPSSTAV
jgi:hypothetical protein